MSSSYLIVATTLILLLFSGFTLYSTYSNKNQVEKSEINPSFSDLPIRFSSFKGLVTGDSIAFEAEVPFTDTYSIQLISNIAKIILSRGGDITVIVKDQTIALNKEDKLKLVISAKTANQIVEYKVTPMEHKILQPFDVTEIRNKAQSKRVKNLKEPISASVDYHQPKGKYNSTYIYENNPETLQNEDLNKALIRTNIKNSEVYFTFENGNSKLSYDHYLGYQIINRGTRDAYITVKNIGYHPNGAGSGMGEKEWIDFFNTKFKLLHKSQWTESQKKNFQAYFGFSDTYQPHDFQPITYLLPPGKLFYVMGGTTADSHMKINVDNSADIKVTGWASNGAVLFDVVGEIEAVFYAYTHYSKVQMDNLSNLGYVTSRAADPNIGACYKGIMRENRPFNFMSTQLDITDDHDARDVTINLRTTKNEGISQTGVPYSKIENIQMVDKQSLFWVTNLNPFAGENVIGNDMIPMEYIKDVDKTSYITNWDYYDGRGQLGNLGNWMTDYIEEYTFNNQGSRDRLITFSKIHTGCIAIFVKDENGNIIQGTPQYAIRFDKTQYGDAINDIFIYSEVIPANTKVVRYIEFVLLGNSYGSIKHTISLQ